VCYSQGPELGHVVKTGHRQARDFVVIQCAVKQRQENIIIIL